MNECCDCARGCEDGPLVMDIIYVGKWVKSETLDEYL